MKLLQETKSKFLRNLFLSEFQIGTETRKRAPSLGTQFKKSLDSLMNILSACQPFFIRCIKPNEYKAPNVSNPPLSFFFFSFCFINFDKFL
jgi:myosin-7